MLRLACERSFRNWVLLSAFQHSGRCLELLAFRLAGRQLQECSKVTFWRQIAFFCDGLAAWLKRARVTEARLANLNHRGRSCLGRLASYSSRQIRRPVDPPETDPGRHCVRKIDHGQRGAACALLCVSRTPRSRSAIAGCRASKSVCSPSALRSNSHSFLGKPSGALTISFQRWSRTACAAPLRKNRYSWGAWVVSMPVRYGMRSIPSMIRSEGKSAPAAAAAVAYRSKWWTGSS